MTNPNPIVKETNITLGGVSVIDPRNLYQQATRQGLPTGHWYGKANSYSLSRGKEPSKAYLLILKEELDKLTLASAQTLVFTEDDNTLTLPGLYITEAVALYPSYKYEGPGLGTADDETVYLVKLEDARVFFHLAVCTQDYNIRAPLQLEAVTGTDPDCYVKYSLDGGATVWTWDTLIEDIWALLPVAPGAPITELENVPASKPENFFFEGIPAYDALFTVLEAAGHTLVYNPVTNVFTTVELGQTQAGLSAALNDIDNTLDRTEPESITLLRPHTIRVFFPRKPKWGVSEEIYREKSWTNARTYYKSIATGLSGTKASTILPIWDHAIAVEDTYISESDSFTPANDTELDARALEIKNSIVDQYTNSDDNNYYKYIGIKTSSVLFPGSQIEQIAWRDYGGSDGMTTQLMGIKRHIGNLRPVLPMLTPSRLSQADSSVRPEQTALVEIYHSDTFVEAHGDNYYLGKIVYYIPSGKPWTPDAEVDITDCYVMDMSGRNFVGTHGLHGGERFIGRLVGRLDDGSNIWPLYAIRSSIAIIKAELTENLGVAGNAAANIMSSGVSITVYDYILKTNMVIPSGQKILVAVTCSETIDQFEYCLVGFAGGGASGTFVTADVVPQTVTVNFGVITNIV